jgi:DNA-directed RNA polymerase specialized sigma24 family protein
MRRAKIETLYRRYSDPLARRASWTHEVSDGDSEDLSQDVFVVALRKMGPDGNAGAYLTKVLDRLAANLKRKNARRAALLARHYCLTDEYVEIEEYVEEES